MAEEDTNNHKLQGDDRELLERIYESTEKTRKYIFWIQVLSIMKVVMFVIAFISVLFYMLPLIQQAMSTIRSF